MVFQRTINIIKRNKKGISGLLIILIIILAIIVLGIALIFILRGGAFSEIGQLDYTYDSPSNNEFTLKIYNYIGLIDIQYDDLQTELMKATLVVFGRSNADLSDAINFTSSEVESEIIVSFNSDNTSFNFFNKKAFYQNLYITIHPNATVKYNLETDIGLIDFNSDSLATSIIKQLDVKTNTGNINVDFGQSTYITTNFVKIISSIGSISLISQEILVATSVTFNITSTIGNINLLISYNNVPEANYSIIHNVQCTSGNIDLLYSFSNEVGLIINATTNVGTIDIPGGGTSYQSPDIGSKTAIYEFDFLTTIGNIKAAFT